MKLRFHLFLLVQSFDSPLFLTATSKNYDLGKVTNGGLSQQGTRILQGCSIISAYMDSKGSEEELWLLT